MRKSVIGFFIVLIVCLASPNSLLAGWTQLNPQIIGGTLPGSAWAGMAHYPSGNILLSGGRTTNSYCYNRDTWIFNIDKCRWTKMAPMPNFVGTMGHGIVNLEWGNLLIFGGHYYSGSTLYETNTTSIYNSNTNAWNTISPSVSGGNLDTRANHAMCHLQNGKVLLFGGKHNANGTYYNQTWLYESAQNSWQLLSPTITGGTLNARSELGMVYIGNSKAIMFGGWNGSEYFNDTWLFDLIQNQWTKMTPTIIGGVLSGRRSIGMAYVGGDKVLVFGGKIADTETITNEIWLYDLSDDQWTNLTDMGSSIMPTARYGASMAYAGLGQVIMFGGKNASVYLNDTWIFSIPNNVKDTATWQSVPAAVQISWSLPEELGDAQFSIYRDGLQIAPSVAAGAPVQGMIPYVYLDHTAEPGNIYRYQIKETYPVMNSEIFYPEIGVPYCP